MTERRHDHRRDEDDPEKRLRALQFNVERRHTENVQRFDTIDERLNENAHRLDSIERALAAHLAEEGQTREMIKSVHECVDRNAAELLQQIVGCRDELRIEIADMKDNFLPLLIKDAGKK